MIAVAHVVGAMDIIKPFNTKEEFANHGWPILAARTFNGYWPTWELQEDRTAQRLRASPYSVRKDALAHVAALDTMEQQYKAACCVAVGVADEFDLRALLKKAIEKDLPRFIATIAPYRPAPSWLIHTLYTENTCEPARRKGICSSEELPFFFIAQSKKMAKRLWLFLGADYSVRAARDNKTILHHMCTHPPMPKSRGHAGNEIIKLLKFCIAKGADVHACDAQGRTPLHCAALYNLEQKEECIVPMLIFLLAQGVDGTVKDAHGKTYKDYLLINRYAPVACALGLAYTQDIPDLQGVCYRAQDVATLICEEHQEIDEVDQVVTLSFMQQCVPLVPERSDDLSCKVLNTDASYSGGRRVLACKRKDISVSDDAGILLEQEFKRIFLNWHTVRGWVALTIATRLGYLFDSSELRHMVKHAFLEDDCAFIQYMLRHKLYADVHRSFCPRSVAMAKLVAKYIDVNKQDYEGNTMYHALAEHGALMDPAVFDFVRSLDGDKLLENYDHLKPIEVLLYNSYRYKGQLEKLRTLVYLLWPRVAWASDDTRLMDMPVSMPNLHTGKTVHDLSQEMQRLWKMRETAEILELFIGFKVAEAYNAAHHPGYNVRDVMWKHAMRAAEKREVNKEVIARLAE